ncbi:MAG: sugar phosphate nucleotidyltransferase [Candidatus Hermodarchaeota archaeon]
MQTIIMAGGEGRRLLPYTAILPKPLMPMGEIPILEIILLQLKHYGFKQVILAVGYLAELIQAYFGNGEKFGLDIRYSREKENLGTIGPLSLIDELEEDFLVMNGDILTDLNFREFFGFHKKSGNLITIASFTKEIQIDLGVLKTDNQKLMTDYVEKPILNYQVSMGIYGVNQKILDHIPMNQYFDIPNLMLKLLNLGIKPNIFSHKGRWLDIGRKEDYESALEEFRTNEKIFLPK